MPRTVPPVSWAVRHPSACFLCFVLMFACFRRPARARLARKYRWHRHGGGGTKQVSACCPHVLSSSRQRYGTFIQVPAPHGGQRRVKLQVWTRILVAPARSAVPREMGLGKVGAAAAAAAAAPIDLGVYTVDKILTQRWVAPRDDSHRSTGGRIGKALPVTPTLNANPTPTLSANHSPSPDPSPGPGPNPSPSPSPGPSPSPNPNPNPGAT